MKPSLKNTLKGLTLILLFALHWQGNTANAQCGSTTYTIDFSGSSYYDETYCEIRNLAGTVVKTIGPNTTSSTYLASGTAPHNGPFTFWVSTNGINNDNTPSWTVTASGGGGIVLSGSTSGGDTLINRGSFCHTVQSANADLNALTLSSGTLSPNFGRNTLNYTANVASSTASITLTPTKAQANATIEVSVNNGAFATVNSGSPSGSLSLNYGSNSILVKVTAQNGTTTKTYSLTVFRLNALNLVGLPETALPQGSYGLRALSSTYTGPLLRINISGNFYDVYADSITGDFTLNSNVSAVLGTYDTAISPVTSNELNSLVSGSTTATVAVWYDQSGNTNRNALQANTSNQPIVISSGSIVLNNLKPSIQFSGDKFLTITSSSFNSNLSGTIVYNASGANNASGIGNAWQNMNGILGANQTGTTNDFAYGIYNNKFTAGNGGVSLGDTAISGHTTSNNGVSRINSWTRNTSTGALSLFVAKNGLEVNTNLNTGTRAAVTNLAIGANQVAASGQVFFTGKLNELLLFTHIYSNTEIQTIENNQAAYFAIPSANANLNNLSLNTGAISPSFSTLTSTYTSEVMVSSIIITPTISDTNGLIEISRNNISFDPILSGEPSDTFALITGLNTFYVRVTAEDGITIKTYILNITRGFSNDANLVNLVPNSLNLTPSFIGSTQNYTCTVPFAFKSFRVTPTLSNDSANIQVRINGGVYSNLESDSLSNALFLNAGSNTVEIKVTAEDGITEKVYSINVTRNAAVANYLAASDNQISLTSILTVGEAITGYKMVGIPDGLGAFDNNNGTFTLLMNHKLDSNQGLSRAHGSTGAFVSKWVINKADLTIESGSDLIRNVKLWNTATQSYDLYDSASPMPIGFSKFSSADLPVVSGLYNSSSTFGTLDKILLSGEENGAEGRAFAHVLTGVNADTTVELPFLGKLNWENVVVCPSRGQKTIIAGLDNEMGGQIYFYSGIKSDSGSAIEKAGLTNGKLFGVKVTGLSDELNGSIPAPNTTFTMVDLGIVKDSSGAGIELMSNSLGATKFLQPEDGAWDPKSPADFYFVTSNTFNNPSRLWRLRFTNIRNPEFGGTITAVLDGTEGIKMMDNMVIDTLGRIIIQEDAGNNAHLGKVWLYNIANDQLLQLAEHDSTRFKIGGSNFLTQEEEASGVIDMGNILGTGKYLFVSQAHYATNSELVEGGQLLSMTISTTSLNPVAINQDSLEIGTASPTTALNLTCSNVLNADYYNWTVPAGVVIVSGQGTNALEVRVTDPIKFVTTIAKPRYIYCQALNSISNSLSSRDSVRISKTLPGFEVNTLISNPNNNLGNPKWTSTVGVGSNGKIVNVASTAGLKVGDLIKLKSGSGIIGTSNTVDSIVSSTQFLLKNDMSSNVSNTSVLNAYVVPQNKFTAYVSAAGATNLSTMVTVSTTEGLSEGMLLEVVSGTGLLKEGTIVSKIINGQNFIISLAPTVNLTNSAVVRATPVLTNACPIKVNTGISSEFDFTIDATPVRNIGYQYILPKGTRISRIGDSVITGYDTARISGLKTVSTPITNIGVVFDSLFTSGYIYVKPYNNAGFAPTYRLLIKIVKAVVFKVTSTGAAVKNTTVRYTASVTNGSEVTGYKWTIPTTNVIAHSGVAVANVITTTTDTLSLSFGNLFKSGSLKVEAINNCGTGSPKTYALNGTLTLTKSGQNMELVEQLETEELPINVLSVYPNPSQNNFTLSINTIEKDVPAHVTVLNMMGQVMEEFMVSNRGGLIYTNHTHQMPAGLYFVSIKIGSEIFTEKILVNP
jgi:hypothetical protein